MPANCSLLLVSSGEQPFSVVVREVVVASSAEFELRDGGRPDLEVSSCSVESDVAGLPRRSKITVVGNFDSGGQQAKDFSNNSAFEHPKDLRCRAACRALSSYVGAGARFGGHPHQSDAVEGAVRSAVTTSR